MAGVDGGESSRDAELLCVELVQFILFHQRYKQVGGLSISHELDLAVPELDAEIVVGIAHVSLSPT
jgi:hypothetical protein